MAKTAEARSGAGYARIPGAAWLTALSKYKYLYILLIPTLALIFVFQYIPMYGIMLAFKEYGFNKSILDMDWVGVKHFSNLFIDNEFWRATRNTVIISFFKLLTGFPFPILLALLLNEVRKSSTKRILQTVYTFPHFLSWVLVVGILTGLLTSDGLINQVLLVMGLKEINFLMNNDIFRGLLYTTEIWKGAGWNAIIYMAAIASINPELYEAAEIDGATRLQKAAFITWPCIMGTAVILLILSLGRVMNAGFDQVLNLYNPAVYEKGDIIDTYIYRRTFLLGADFSSSTAVGLFKSVINFALVVVSNQVVKLFGEEGLF